MMIKTKKIMFSSIVSFVQFFILIIIYFSYELFQDNNFTLYFNLEFRIFIIPVIFMIEIIRFQYLRLVLGEDDV